jgi:hypothetical protein
MSAEEGRRETFDEARGYLPWMISAVVLIFGAARIEALRPHLATIMALAAPVVAATSGVYRFRGAHHALETCALVVAGLVVVAAEVCVAGAFLGMARLAPLVGVARHLLIAAVGAALALHTLAVGRGLNPRFGAWIGMAAAFAWFVSGYVGDDRFGAVFSGFFFALAVGGGLGLLAGEALRRFFRHR